MNTHSNGSQHGIIVRLLALQEAIQNPVCIVQVLHMQKRQITHSVLMEATKVSLTLYTLGPRPVSPGVGSSRVTSN